MAHRLHNDNVCVRDCKDLCHSWICCFKVRCHSSVTVHRDALESGNRNCQEHCAWRIHSLYLYTVWQGPDSLFGGIPQWVAFLLPCAVPNVRTWLPTATCHIHKVFHYRNLGRCFKGSEWGNSGCAAATFWQWSWPNVAARLLKGSQEEYCGLRNIIVGVCQINIFRLQETCWWHIIHRTD